MTTYYGLYGQKVQYLASDPTDVQTGQVWYNSTSATLKVRAVTTTGTWAAGGSMPAPRTGFEGVGTQTAGLVFGGSPDSNVTLKYDGTSWTPTGNLNTARGGLGGAGTQTAALAFGGVASFSRVTNTELFNGTSWTNNPTGLPAGKDSMGTAGTQTAALNFGGYTGLNFTNTGASFNGSTWTATPTINTTRGLLGGCGTQTAALASGGISYPPTIYYSAVESWNGTSWTTNPATLNTARESLRTTGTQTAALSFGGDDAPGRLGATELWNGSTYTSNPTGLSTARNDFAGFGNSTLAAATGGSTPSATAATEEWTGPGVGTTKTVTVS